MQKRSLASPRPGLSVLLILLCGCSSLFPSVQKENEPVNIGVNEEGQDLFAPISLEVLDDVNDGQTLYVRGKLSIFGPVGPESTIVKLIGLSEGIVVAEKEKTLQELVSPAAVGQGDFPFALAVSSRDVTDYHVEVSWVPPTSMSSPKAQAKVESPAVLFAEERVFKALQCETHPCKAHFRVKGVLENLSEQSVSFVRLRVGFLKDTDSGELPGASLLNEREIDLKGLSLAPGTKRALELNLGAQETYGDDGALIPRVEVVGVR